MQTFKTIPMPEKPAGYDQYIEEKMNDAPNGSIGISDNLLETGDNVSNEDGTGEPKTKKRKL